MDQPIIELRNIKKSFGGALVLKGVNLSIYKGQITTVIGKSGGGKSVLLKHIIGLLAPDEGEILFGGKPKSSMTKDEKQAWRRRISYVFQGTALFDSMTIFDNIALPLSEKRRAPKDKIRLAVMERMEQLDIAPIADKYPSQISGGMKKRVGLARALVTGPEIVLFDEPTTGLDPIRKSAVHAMIGDYQKRFGFTGVVVSHEIPDIFFISQRVAMLNDGMMHFQGSPDELQSSGDPTIQRFLRGIETPHDALTELSTRAQIQNRYHAEMDQLTRHETAFSLAMFTIENLASVPDHAGLVTGQTVLRNFAQELKRHLRPSDTCARFGMDRILAVLPNTGQEEATGILSHVLSVMDKSRIVDSDLAKAMCLSVRADVVQATAESTIQDILASAESAGPHTVVQSVC